MPSESERTHSERVLICAPFGRDATLIEGQLRAAGLTGEVCASIEELSAAINQGAGAALVADEALRGPALECLARRLAEQPPWSDFPLVVMTSGGDATAASRYRLRLLKPLGNINLLERPLRTATLISSLRAALRARRHQYQLAEQLRQRDANQREIERRNEELVKANRLLEEFAYVASHDLQEPLRMVKIYAQLLVRNGDRGDKKAQEYAGFVSRGVDQMEQLLRDLLTFSRTIQPDTPILESADLSSCLSEAMSALNGRIQENTAQIKCGHLPTVFGNEGQLTQVFQNLLSNALKYRKADVPPKIAVSAERQEDGKWIVVSVSDNGIGFEPQQAERIFGLFKRLHKDAYPGTGLGLAICQRIVERYGGRIWAEGRPGRGATFYFTLRSTDVVNEDASYPSS